MAVDHPAGGGVTGDLGSLPGSGESPGGHGNVLQDSCLENPMDREATAYGPPGCKESDTTEPLSTAQHKYITALVRNFFKSTK